MTAVNAWDPRPLAEIGDVDANTTFAAVGYALTQWEGMETALANQFWMVLGGDKGLADKDGREAEAARHAYGAIVGFSSRLEMLKAVSDVYFRYRRMPEEVESLDEMHRRFRKHLDSCSKFSARRNEIAHGHVISFNKDGEKFGHFLVPSRYNSRKWENIVLPKYRYNALDIMHYATMFRDLRNFSFDLYDEIRVQRGGGRVDDF